MSVTPRWNKQIALPFQKVWQSGQHTKTRPTINRWSTVSPKRSVSQKRNFENFAFQFGILALRFFGQFELFWTVLQRAARKLFNTFTKTCNLFGFANCPSSLLFLRLLTRPVQRSLPWDGRSIEDLLSLEGSWTWGSAESLSLLVETGAPQLNCNELYDWINKNCKFKDSKSGM